MAEETKHEIFLKRAQLVIAVMVGVVTLILGLYNAKKTFFSKTGPGGISLEVSADQGRKASYAAVQILKVQGGIVVNSQTSTDGTYVKKDLEPGNYTVKVSKEGFQPEMLVVAVEPSRTAEVNLQLKPSSSPIRSAVEEVGASWIKDLGAKKESK